MIRAIPAGILRQVLLVIVGAFAVFNAETSKLPDRWQPNGRFPVDVDATQPVDCWLPVSYFGSIEVG